MKNKHTRGLKNEKEKEAQDKKKEEDKEVLIKWIREQGYKNEMVFCESHDKSNGWSFGLLRPHGTFTVDI